MKRSKLIVELFAMAGIISAGVGLAWLAKIKYQPSIEKRLDEIEARDASIASAAASSENRRKLTR